MIQVVTEILFIYCMLEVNCVNHMEGNFHGNADS